jgi:hypothetical protein
VEGGREEGGGRKEEGGGREEGGTYIFKQFLRIIEDVI